MLSVQSVLRQLQVRVHEGRLLHHLHVGRQGLRGDDSILLPVPEHLLRIRLLLLHLLQQHADLLRYVCVVA